MPVLNVPDEWVLIIDFITSQPWVPVIFTFYIRNRKYRRGLSPTCRSITLSWGKHVYKCLSYDMNQLLLPWNTILTWNNWVVICGYSDVADIASKMNKGSLSTKENKWLCLLPRITSELPGKNENFRKLEFTTWVWSFPILNIFSDKTSGDIDEYDFFYIIW